VHTTELGNSSSPLGSRYINISGFGNHVAISGYQSGRNHLATLMELTVVENTGFTVSNKKPQITLSNF